MSKHSLLLGTWGNPRSWKNVKYILGKNVIKGIDRDEWFGRSSTGALAHFLNPVETVIFSTWTLSMFKDFSDEITVEGLLSSSREYIEEAIQGNGYFSSNTRYRIKVLPGVGVFKKKDVLAGERVWIFRGGLGYYFLETYYMVLELLRKYDVKNVVLDISQGINYMPILLREAVELALRHYSAVYRKKIVFYIVNSDPVTAENQSSNIHLIEKRFVEGLESSAWLASEFSTFVPELLKSKKVFRVYDVRGKDDVMIFKDIQGKFVKAYLNYGRLTQRLVDIINNGILLYIAQYMRDEIEDLKNGLEEIVKVFSLYKDEADKILKVDKHDNKVVIKLIIDPVKRFGVLHAMMDFIYKSFENVEFDSKEAVSLDALKKLAERMSFSKYVKIILEEELHNIEKRVLTFYEKCEKFKTRMETDSLPYLEIYDRTKFKGEDVIVNCDEEPGRMTEPNLRNFIAHGGLERNVIRVGIRDGKVFLSYRDKETVDKILNRLGVA